MRAQHVAHVYLIKSHRMTKLDHLSSPWVNSEISSTTHRMPPHITIFLRRLKTTYFIDLLYIYPFMADG